MESPQCLDAFDMKTSKRSKRNKYVTGISWDRKRVVYAVSSTKTKEIHCNGTNV